MKSYILSGTNENVLVPPVVPPPTHTHTHTHTKSSSVCTILVGALACYFQLMKMSLSIPPPKHFRHFIVKNLIRVHLACYFRFLFPLEHVLTHH